MKKLHTGAKPHQSFRRFVRKLFASLLKHQSSNHRKEHQKMVKALQDIQSSIEIIAREIARQAKRGD
jgi:hypothetical protein